MKKMEMEFKEYQEKAARTLAQLENPLMNELHMVMGLATESAEIVDVYKKHIAYGKELDDVNLQEEIGDIMWYIANLISMKNWNMSRILSTNIDKLSARYPEKFTEENAITRNLEVERQILEQ